MNIKNMSGETPSCRIDPPEQYANIVDGDRFNEIRNLARDNEDCFLEYRDYVISTLRRHLLFITLSIDPNNLTQENPNLQPIHADILSHTEFFGISSDEAWGYIGQEGLAKLIERIENISFNTSDDTSEGNN